MKLHYSLVLPFLISIATASAPRIEIGYRLGYAGYLMHDLKDLQSEYVDEFQSTYEIPLKIISAFPPYYYSQLRFAFTLKGVLGLGVLAGYSTTGGKVHYSDYSGEISSKQLLKRKYFGLDLRYLTKETQIFNLVGGLQISHTTTDVDFREFLIVYEDTLINNQSFQDTGFGVEPYALMEFQFSFLSLGLVGGGQWQFSKPLESDKGVILRTRSKKIYADWTGWRLGLEISIYYQRN